MATLTIARLTFHEAVRRRIVLAALLMGAAFLVVYGFGLRFILNDIRASTQSAAEGLEIREVQHFLTLAGLYVINFLTVMMSVLTSVDTLSGEIGSGTMHTIAAKPVRRWEIVMGKWLGFVGMLTAYLLLMAGGVLVLSVAQLGEVVPNLWRGLALMWLNVLLLLSISLLGSAFLSTLATGVLVFGLYGVAFVGGWIEHIGSFLQNETAIRVGIVSSLLLPSESLWRRAAFEMQSPLIAAIGFSPFSAMSVPSPLMIWYAIVYGGLAVGGAIWLFGRRDL